jgi:selenide,water dikinase
MWLQSKGYRTGAVEASRCYVGDILEIEDTVDDHFVELLVDPQTSGGLLIACPAYKEAALKDNLAAKSSSGSLIGRVREEGPKVALIGP